MGLLFGRKPPPPPPPPPPKRKSFGMRAVLLGPIYAAAFGSVGRGLMLFWCSAVYPDPLSLRPKDPPPLIRILARDGSLLAERGGGDDYVPLDLLPRHVANAVIATEDQRFYEHHGVDPWGLLRAMIANVRSRRFVQGGSTLTQQLAKNLYLTSDRTFARKLEELALAIWLEARLSKSDILELYLNRVYLGSGAYGIDAAARRYFGKPARKLTLAESALIAGLLKAPSKYSPLTSPTAARARGRLVLGQMLRAGLITAEAEHAASAAMSRVAQVKQAEANGAEYAVDYVLEQLPRSSHDAGPEIIVETTLDSKLQALASRVVEQHLAAQGDALRASEAAVVVLDPQGGIRALVGGRGYADSPFNRAVKAQRQPGSAFKPFVYLTALEGGFTPDSVVEDLPLTVAGWAPRNDNGEYQGAMTLRTALSRSVNTVAVRLALKVGPARVAATARRLGIKSPLGKDASLALGTSEVSLLELTGAYNVLANGGREAEPYVLRRVFTHEGRILYVRKARRPRQLVAPAHVGAMNEMLNAALISGTGRRAALPRHPAAGKTGTSQSYRDAWFVGYTGHLTTGVWAGNDDGRAMNHVVGGSLPAEIWRTVMLAAHEGKSPRPLAGTAVVGAPLGAPLDTHPPQPIAEDFIARALQDRPTAVGDVGPSGAPSRGLSGIPPGMMSLGSAGAD
jgi:penicillin-binding protein 1A